VNLRAKNEERKISRKGALRDCHSRSNRESRIRKINILIPAFAGMTEKTELGEKNPKIRDWRNQK
jgi:ribosomal protein L39E